MFSWEENPGKTQDMLDRLYFSAGLGNLSVLLAAALATQPLISGREWTGGIILKCKNVVFCEDTTFYV